MKEKKEKEEPTPLILSSVRRGGENGGEKEGRIFSTSLIIRGGGGSHSYRYRCEEKKENVKSAALKREKTQFLSSREGD